MVHKVCLTGQSLNVETHFGLYGTRLKQKCSWRERNTYYLKVLSDEEKEAHSHSQQIK